VPPLLELELLELEVTGVLVRLFALDNVLLIVPINRLQGRMDDRPIRPEALAGGALAFSSRPAGLVVQV